MYRFPVSCEIKRRVSCFTKVGYSLKIQENTRSGEDRMETVNLLSGGERPVHDTNLRTEVDRKDKCRDAGHL